MFPPRLTATYGSELEHSTFEMRRFRDGEDGFGKNGESRQPRGLSMPPEEMLHFKRGVPL